MTSSLQVSSSKVRAYSLGSKVAGYQEKIIMQNIMQVKKFTAQIINIR